MKLLRQNVLGSGLDISFFFLADELFHLRLGRVGSLFFFCCMSGNESKVDCMIVREVIRNER